MASLKYGNKSGRDMLPFFLTVLMRFCIFLYAFSFPGVLACPGIKQSSTVFLFSVGSLWCNSVYVLLGWTKFDVEALVSCFLCL